MVHRARWNRDRGVVVPGSRHLEEINNLSGIIDEVEREVVEEDKDKNKDEEGQKNNKEEVNRLYNEIENQAESDESDEEQEDEDKSVNCEKQHRTLKYIIVMKIAWRCGIRKKHLLLNRISINKKKKHDVYSPYNSNKIADKVYPISSKIFDVYINGCKTFYADNVAIDHCFDYISNYMMEKEK
ncbi:hypothetical protein BDA99DRAFT_533974 [Phascolomyces articulosus]|uniref:Uncharacterized protein n=1 Tax=Phascolomyces articulosus TaxID=60185 RepID=A0AAD5KHR0_9FUNG|nr:hypothetical protein BDA99DRAFT_533974 [Phascolomyces articulosus]